MVCMKQVVHYPMVKNCYGKNIIRISSRYCSKMSAVPNKKLDSFVDAWPGLLQSIVQDKLISTVPEVANWVGKVLEYNAVGGKYIRGMTTVYTYEHVEKPENITEETLKLARILGWCVEILQAHLIVLDDIMDGATTRRGVLGWYRLPNVGLGAVIDGLLLCTAMYQALKIHFKTHPNYGAIVEQFQNTVVYTQLGQSLEFNMAKKKKDFSSYTVERYEEIIKLKTGYYTFQLPVALGLLLANITDKKIHERTDTISLQLGKLFQMQDDYIDCYGDANLIGKDRTDIREGKCTWFAVQALNRCNRNQRIVFNTCYGSNQPAHIERIQTLYNQMGLKQEFKKHEKQLYDEIVMKSKELETSTGVPAKMVLTLLKMLDERRQ